jgi:hypothetical protein
VGVINETISPCPKCGALPEIKFSRNHTHKYQLKCSNSECTNKLLIDRDFRISAIRYWNRVCARLSQGKPATTKKYTPERDEEAEMLISPGNRCPRCLLLMPCNACIPSIEVFADVRNGYDVPAPIGSRG